MVTGIALNPHALAGTSYIFIAILMFIEGPIVTYVAAFAASLDLLNVYIILLLASLGNIIGDIFLYSIGRFGKKTILRKYFEKSKRRRPMIKRIEHNLKTHTGKALAFIKTVPPFPVPGLIMAGFVEVPLERFLLYSIPLSISIALIFLLGGYYTGQAYLVFIKFFKRIELAVSATVLLVIVGWFIFKFFQDRIRKIETKNLK